MGISKAKRRSVTKPKTKDKSRQTPVVGGAEHQKGFDQLLDDAIFGVTKTKKK